MLVVVVVVVVVALRCVWEEEEGVGSLSSQRGQAGSFLSFTGPWAVQQGRRASGESAREGAWPCPLILAANTNPRIGKSQYCH
jgi:hypothetical protein